jgi:hypothetical protein
VRHLRVCLCMCVCVCTSHTLTHSFSYIRFCFHDSLVQPLLQGRPQSARFLCAPGSPWSSRWRSCIERTRVASAATPISVLPTVNSVFLILEQLSLSVALLSAAASSVLGIWR